MSAGDGQRTARKPSGRMQEWMTRNELQTSELQSTFRNSCHWRGQPCKSTEGKPWQHRGEETGPRTAADRASRKGASTPCHHRALRGCAQGSNNFEMTVWQLLREL